jgi:hypothetical protein
MNFGCEFLVDDVTVLLVSVEEQYLGLSLTRHMSALTFDRASVELKDLDQIRALRDNFSAYLIRKEREAKT